MITIPVSRHSTKGKLTEMNLTALRAARYPGR